MGIKFQAGPIERVAIPKDNGKNRSYAFITYKYQVSVPYAMSVFSGTKLFNRDLRLNNRQMNRNNDGNSANTNAAHSNNNNGNNQNRGGGQGPMEPRPLLAGNAPLPHQFQMPTNPFGNAALRGLTMNPMLNNLMPPPSMPRMEFPANQQFDIQALLQFGSQMMLGNNGLDLSNMSNSSADDSGHRHQSKIMHRHENRTHNQNANYARDSDRRNDRRRNRSRSRSRERQNDSNWMRNRGGGGGGRDNRKNDRHDRDRRGSDKNRRR